MKKNVLVFPCGSEIGLEINRSLKFSTHFTLFGGSSVSDHGEFVYENYISDMPFVNDKRFIEKLNEQIKNNNIDYIFPAHDDVALRLARAHNEGAINCSVIGSPLEACEIARSKLSTYKFFRNIIKTPKVFSNINEIKTSDLPIFLKPDVGQGSKGVHLAKSLEEADFYYKENKHLLLLEFLPGKEYTVDCFTSHEGRLLFCEGRERSRIMNGISVRSSIHQDKRFLEIAQKINKQLTFRGVWFFQLKENKRGELVLLEIAARVAGTMALARAKGINLPLLSLFDAMGLKVNIIENKDKLEIDRALENRYRHSIKYKHVYIDFDDLLILNKKVNPQVVAFIFQSRNNGITIHLITRHKAILENTLKEFRLAEIFDEIILLKEGDKKSAYIKDKNSIFIDDSFAEREEVQKKLHIPVFDAHMIESLME